MRVDTEVAVAGNLEVAVAGNLEAGEAEGLEVGEAEGPGAGKAEDLKAGARHPHLAGRPGDESTKPGKSATDTGLGKEEDTAVVMEDAAGPVGKGHLRRKGRKTCYTELKSLQTGQSKSTPIRRPRPRSGAFFSQASLARSF